MDCDYCEGCGQRCYHCENGADFCGCEDDSSDIRTCSRCNGSGDDESDEEDDE